MPTLPVTEEEYLNSIESFLSGLKPKNKEELFQAVVDAPFRNKSGVVKFDLGFIALQLVDKLDKIIYRVALSKTKMARDALKISSKPFKYIRIPVGNEHNILNKAIKSGEIEKTSDWYYLFLPTLTVQQAKLSQSMSGIECSLVSKLNVKDGGTITFHFYQPLDDLEDLHYEFVRRYSKMTGKILRKHATLLKT